MNIEQKKEIVKIFGIEYDSKIKKYLFIDGGSNIGQGYNFFKNIFKSADFALFEPNQFCHKQLEVILKNNNVIELNKKALYINNNQIELKFDKTTDLGASIISEHNLGYKKQTNKSIIECVDINDYILNKLNTYNNIILKLDVESSEYDILEYLIEKNTLIKLDAIIVEWHEKYMLKEDQEKFLIRKNKILDFCKSNNIKIFDWI